MRDIMLVFILHKHAVFDINIGMIKNIKFSAYLIGAIIGAGFASGREIVSFFSHSGLNLYSCIFCGALLFAFCFVFLLTARATNAGNFNDTTGLIAPKSKQIFSIISCLNCFIVLSAMLAGFGAVGNILLPLPPR